MDLTALNQERVKRGKTPLCNNCLDSCKEAMHCSINTCGTYTCQIESCGLCGSSMCTDCAVEEMNYRGCPHGISNNDHGYICDACAIHYCFDFCEYPQCNDCFNKKMYALERMKVRGVFCNRCKGLCLRKKTKCENDECNYLSCRPGFTHCKKHKILLSNIKQ